MKFAFLVHPLSQEHRAILALEDLDGLRNCWGGDVFEFCQQLHRNLRQFDKLAESQTNEIRVIDEFPHLESAKSTSCEGRFYEIPLDAAQFLEHPNRAIELMEQAVDHATAWGAEIVGLGSMTGIVGSHGQHMADRGPIAITTGNSLTVFSAKKNLERACELSGIDLSQETVAVIGIPGSIGSALAKLIAPLCKSLICVSRSETTRAKNLAASLDSPLLTDIRDALSTAKVVVSATSTGDCIDQNWLLPGSLVIDVAVPTDVVGNNAIRDDILILSGGMLMTPPMMSRESRFIGGNHGVVPSCFGETMVLALENRRECFSVGRNLSVDGITEIGSLASQHGFDFSHLSTFGVRVDDQQISRFKKSVYRTRKYANREDSIDGLICAKSKKLAPREHSELGKAAEQHRRYINPVLVAIGKQSGFLKTLVRGEGSYVWDEQGRRYLDFVSGYGSLNLGHNHPQVTHAIQSAITTQAPGFSQAAVNPHASELADRLISCSPNGLEMVSFCSSGAEAIEAAIKLVRITSERPRILYCHQSYHGKTLGALSLTGNRKFQKPFGPLVESMDAIEFGDSAQLETALKTKKYAAFFVEPIQCEGGMNVAPPGYMNDVESLCQQTQTLFVLDEIQTGLGRTGKLFCADHFGITPDIMTLAKSLGGGLVPCGAMLCRRDLWLKAYGSTENFTLHSSTFAGGSLAMVAGLATLDVLEQTELIENCERRSEQLLQGLGEFARRSDLIADVRGQGLLAGIEFNPLPENIIRHFAAQDSTGIHQFMAPQAIEVIRNLAPIYVMQSLLDEFGIYTQIARSKPNVLRIQPPLNITKSQVDEFLGAIEQCCSELSFSNQIIDTMISKSTIGNLDKKPTANR